MPYAAAVVAAAAGGPVILCEAIKGRKNLRLQTPTTNTNPVFVKHERNVDTAGINQGIEMPPGTIITLWAPEDADVEWAWWGIVAAGTETVIVDEVM